MGYKVKRKVFVLQFEDPDFAGLEVRANSTSTGKILDLIDQAEAMRKGAASTGLEKVTDLIDEFAKALLSWNLEDENDVPAPATREGLLSQDMDWLFTVILAWVDAMVSISPSLGKGSTSGTPFPEVSIPMEIPSPNLTNSPTPN